MILSSAKRSHVSTRELELVEKYIHGLFPIWGIRFISIVDNADTANKGSKKIPSNQRACRMNGTSEDMSENIRSVLTNRRVNGFHIGAFALYGYKERPRSKGHLIIDEEAASSVKYLPCLHKVTEKPQSPVCSMTKAYQIQLNTSVCSGLRYHSLKPKTALYGNTLLSPIC